MAEPGEPLRLPPEIEAVIEEGRRHPERHKPRPRRDMRDPEYRRAYRRQWAGHHLSLLWLRIRVRLARRSHS